MERARRRWAKDDRDSTIPAAGLHQAANHHRHRAASGSDARYGDGWRNRSIDRLIDHVHDTPAAPTIALLSLSHPLSAGVAALGDEVQAGDPCAVVVGTARLASRDAHKCYVKTSPEEFERDVEKHMVREKSASLTNQKKKKGKEERHVSLVSSTHERSIIGSSPRSPRTPSPWRTSCDVQVEPMSETYGFGNPTLDTIYGWVIESAQEFQPPRPVPKLHRLYRSIFSIALDDITAVTVQCR